MCGPAAALFRTDVFRELGGFEDYGTPSDTIFWMTGLRPPSGALAAGRSLLLPRTSGTGISGDRTSPRQYATVDRTHVASAVSGRLPARRARKGGRHAAMSHSAHGKSIWNAARQGDFRLAWLRAIESGISPAEWFRYLRPPRRSGLAGMATIAEVRPDHVHHAFLHDSSARTDKTTGFGSLLTCLVGTTASRRADSAVLLSYV